MNSWKGRMSGKDGSHLMKEPEKIILFKGERVRFGKSNSGKILIWSTETKELIVTLSQSVQNKVELSRLLNIPRTTITSVLSKYRRTGTVETLTRSGRKKRFTNRDRNALKHLVNSNRHLTLQNITVKLNEGKTKTLSQKTVQRVLYSEGYKRRLAKKKVLVREANQKKRVKWCKERRDRTVDNY